jgi:hypothetical protein
VARPARSTRLCRDRRRVRSRGRFAGGFGFAADSFFLAANRAVISFEMPLPAGGDFAPNEFADKLNSLDNEKS